MEIGGGEHLGRVGDWDEVAKKVGGRCVLI